jgi:hypothetical protein
MIFKKEDIDFARKFVETLCIPEEYGISDDDYNDDISYVWVKGFDSEIMPMPKLYHGVSKVVLDFDCLPFVIKIPLNGMWVYDYEKDDGESETFEYFHHASGESEDDYCWDELTKTKAMQYDGFGELAPLMELLTTIDGRNFYIQEKVKPYGETESVKPSKESLELVSSLSRTYQVACPEWVAAIVDEHGLDFWIDFCDWDEDRGGEILQDLHANNYGYDMDGRPVIFDLSGFRD